VSPLVYLDICCFKRPFDDATMERVRREAEAVATILEAASAGKIRLIRSPAHDFENSRNPREDRRLATLLWLEIAAVRAANEPESVARARELEAMGFAPLDALHLAFAEKSGARWFVTTDDRLLKGAQNHQERMRVEVLGPDRLAPHLEGVA
jgi:predicted nucleic acid-binding protein